MVNIVKSFPKINSSNFAPKSPVSDNYNCIAWAYGRNDIKFWPNKDQREYKWPKEITNIEKTDSFIELYKSIGYFECQNGELEEGFEKISIYEKDHKPKHAARQLQNGKWTSKLGDYFDVEHDEFALTGGDYGEIKVYMKRKI